MKKNTNKSWMQYGLLAAVALTLYATGLHAEVIGFAQRGLLVTGLMNPDVTELAQLQEDEVNENQNIDLNSVPKADFNLQLMDANGKVRSLEEFKGKVIFLNLWATWCPPCIAEMPSIDKLHEQMGDEVAFVMLSMDKDFEKAKEFDKRKGYDLPIFTLASNLPAMYQSQSIPTTYVIDPEGNLALTHKGMADYSNKQFVDFLNSIK